ncbi:MAG: hypothetical protein QGG71_24205 [Pirellulaceae bacterium]|jgi:hypothetical protein|nr:hypothetical protein [Pirellulaceae bacterium]
MRHIRWSNTTKQDPLAARLSSFAGSKATAPHRTFASPGHFGPIHQEYIEQMRAVIRGQGYQLELDADDVMLLQDNGFGKLAFVGICRPSAL